MAFYLIGCFISFIICIIIFKKNKRTIESDRYILLCVLWLTGFSWFTVISAFGLFILEFEERKRS